MKILAPLACLLLALTNCGQSRREVPAAPAAPAKAPVALANLETLRSGVFDLVNLERERRRLPPLARAALLDDAAQDHAATMALLGVLSHESPKGSLVARVEAVGYDFTRVAENIAKGQNQVEQVVAGWMASPKHRANILSGDYRELGIGVAAGGTPARPEIYWVQIFGRRD
jgi:uncharacterized protein YkwD